ncbi:hypothetical protein FJT64_006114 [Amphibalanus amphitrite]|uniref:G-protein coupled receptors family 1 profile domain-containing protein n=1 Tax=Amphibalanus amphitrite TaxID=1232801 RepID=A0A6A4VYK4_AMPAM|nr:hypothetical protein FJT64_006114 [Amphibalanus amphitrite]
MLYTWVKTVVGLLLAANFSVPLLTVLCNRYLWEEPMAVVAGNMSFTSFLCGIFIMLIGIYDTFSFQSIPLCRFLQYSGFAVGIAFKMAQVCAAFDQFVAVMYPLRHYSIMIRTRPWLFAAIWCTYAVQIIIGLFAHFLDMETFSEHVGKSSDNSTFTGCRWETALSNVYAIFVEVEMVSFSAMTASLFLYVGVVGHQLKTRLLRHAQQLRRNSRGGGVDENKSFFDNYRAFKKIVAVLSLTVSLDVVAPILRISSRWYPQPTLNGLLHQVRLLGFIFEGWAYGLLNAKLRAAYRKILCGRFTRVVVAPVPGSCRKVDG